MKFRSRSQAGQLLAQQIAAYSQVPQQPVLVVRKLGMPQHPEYAMGAIASFGVRVMNPDAAFLNLPAEELEALVAREQHELQRRERLYRAGRAAPELAGRSVILVDDGMATGSTMRAAIASARRQGAPHITVALAVAAPEAANNLRSEVDAVICVATPVPLRTLEQWYEDFEPVSDAQVCSLLAQARADRSAA